MGRWLTEDEFKPFGDALQDRLGPSYTVEFLSPGAHQGVPEVGACIACRVTYEGNGDAKTVTTDLARTVMDGPSIDLWARTAARDIRKNFGTKPKWRN